MTVVSTASNAAITVAHRSRISDPGVPSAAPINRRGGGCEGPEAWRTQHHLQGVSGYKSSAYLSWYGQGPAHSKQLCLVWHRLCVEHHDNLHIVWYATNLHVLVFEGMQSPHWCFLFQIWKQPMLLATENSLCTAAQKPHRAKKNSQPLPKIRQNQAENNEKR